MAAAKYAALPSTYDDVLTAAVRSLDLRQLSDDEMRASHAEAVTIEREILTRI